jgi:ubiquitin-protein ligase
MRKSPRDRRLKSDFESLQQLQNESSIFSFDTIGSARSLPTKYRLTFRGSGLKKSSFSGINVTSNHVVRVDLGSAYPRLAPGLLWETKIFHPNISNNGVVCLGGYGSHWVPSLTLCEMCKMLWDMIRYKNFDTESPYNREAAHWARSQPQNRFPIDRRPIRDLIGKTLPRKPNFSPHSKRLDQMQVVEITDDGIEILESGIEIIDATVAIAPPRRVAEIMFLDD